MEIHVSVIVPCRNVANFIGECLESVLNQKNIENLNLEVSLFDDSSDDDTVAIAQSYEIKFSEKRIRFVFGCQTSGKPLGVGYAKNRAVQQCSGRFLCFLDSDDVADSSRIWRQFEIASTRDDEFALIGSKFRRIPPESTARYTKWANSLSNSQLYTQIYTANGPTLVAPTWFCSKSLFEKVGGFDESKTAGFPEDLDFFYKALRLGARLYRIDEDLVVYRYHANCASFSVSEYTIFTIRVSEFELNVLNDWPTFTIWNAGKQGKFFYKTLTQKNRDKVVAFCDVDIHKIKHGYYESYERINGKVTIGRRVPIVSHQHAVPPVVICVKLDLTNGQFEDLIRDKQWSEGKDYYFLS